MRYSLFALTLLFCNLVNGQDNKVNAALEHRQDSLTKSLLIRYAMDNPSLRAASARVETAEYNLKSAKNTWLDAIAITGNINEFVVNDNPNANFFPKYNLGITLPFSIFGKQSNLKKAAAAQVDMNVALRQDEERRVVKEVLIRYATYQEKKDVYELQKRISSELDGAYRKIKEDYADGVVTDLDDVNKAFQAYINQQIEERSAKRDYEVSIIDLEQVTGVPMETVLATVKTIMESTPSK